MDKLKPCPFCGGEAEIAHSRNYYAWCDKCETRGNWHATEAEAIEAWNTRAERTCKLIDRGSFMPEHDFYRSECSACGAMFWQTNGHLPRANYCPNCGAKVVE